MAGSSGEATQTRSDARRADVRSDSHPDVGPGSRGRTGDAVDEAVTAALGADIGQADVLDCGGGSGRYAVPLAVAGATVTVLDVSVDALATLQRRAGEAGVADRVHAVQGEAENLAVALPGRVFDAVLAHGVLDVVDALPETFAGIAAAVRPGGVLSILVSNSVAGVLSRALAGDLTGAERELALLEDTATRSGPDTVRRLCAEHGLTVAAQQGIAVFRELVPGQALDAPGARDALSRLEAACACQAPFADIAARVHLLARRPAED